MTSAEKKLPPTAGETVNMLEEAILMFEKIEKLCDLVNDNLGEKSKVTLEHATSIVDRIKNFYDEAGIPSRTITPDAFVIPATRPVAVVLQIEALQDTKTELYAVAKLTIKRYRRGNTDAQ